MFLGRPSFPREQNSALSSGLTTNGGSGSAPPPSPFSFGALARTAKGKRDARGEGLFLHDNSVAGSATGSIRVRAVENKFDSFVTFPGVRHSCEVILSAT